VTERIVMASKGRFDRVPTRAVRRSAGLPFEDTIDPGDFRAWTLDTWHFPPESAKRVGHPAPFPVELPRRVIELNTYKGDCVLDPFMGSGQTAIACIETGRHYVGIDVDESYVDLARERIGRHDLAARSTGDPKTAEAKVAKPRTPRPVAAKSIANKSNLREKKKPSRLAALAPRTRGGTGTDG
jgi:site-specific DNA-methyltransferase (adenine-specific)